MILLDNAAWHTNPLMKRRLQMMDLSVIFSGPYSYSAAPVELVFAALKLGNLNPDRLPTGKRYVIVLLIHYSLILLFLLNNRSLSNLADMVGHKLISIPKSVVIRYWHHTVLSLYGYLYYEKI